MTTGDSLEISHLKVRIFGEKKYVTMSPSSKVATTENNENIVIPDDFVDEVNANTNEVKLHAI